MYSVNSMRLRKVKEYYGLTFTHRQAKVIEALCYWVKLKVSEHDEWTSIPALEYRLCCEGKSKAEVRLRRRLLYSNILEAHRGIGMHSRTFSTPLIQLISLSKPRPKPP